MTYGVCENYDISIKENLLPMGLVEGCKLKNNIQKDQPITHDDVYLPENRLSDKLRQEQLAYFS
jgi:predicted homoserine dehydrogenase-like protein